MLNETYFMSSYIPQVDEYIGKSAEFAQPILKDLRALIHKACPDVVETIKWTCPHFTYNGRILCSMAAFKSHCILGFRMASIMKDPQKIFELKNKNAMGQLGRIESRKDLPDDKTLIAYLKEAALLNAQDFRMPVRQKTSGRRKYKMTKELAAALSKNKKAKGVFDKLTEAKQYEYIEWVGEARTESTQNKRIATSIEWLKEGKSRNWKYT
jgi:uncharacterized protein YdeI (YjbR/CyaY-like superfamily)